MKLYTRPTAPNAIKVLVFAAERGVDLQLIDVGGLPAGEFETIHPIGTVPLLVTESGLRISESLTICQYLDEVAGGERLFGNGRDERARIGMWERRAEILLFNPAIELAHHTWPMFNGRLQQFPEWARENARIGSRLIELIEEELERSPFLAGTRFTAADITAFLGYSALQAFGVVRSPALPPIQRWLEAMGVRPSFEPMRALAAALK